MFGARIKQARLLAKMTQRELALRLGDAGYQITAAAISKYELGKSCPPAQFMLLASSALDVPSTYFMHQHSRSIEWIGFRCRARLSETDRDRIKAYASDVAELQAELRDLLYPGNKSRLPSFAVADLADAESAAEQLRREWDVGDRPLDNLAQTAEDRDVIVIGWHDEKNLFDGLSGRYGDRPVTVINTHFPLDRRRLTLAREIGHWVMNTDPVSGEDEEALAFRFAAALLVPAEHAYRELGHSRNQLNWGELQSLKRKYGISMSAWIRRARDLGIINHSVYRSLNIELRHRGWHKAEPVEYQGDEEPLQLKQMTQRALAEGALSPDRIESAGITIECYAEDELISSHLTARDLLAMPEQERQAVMEKAFALAAEEDFEIFEANEIVVDYDEAFDAETYC